METFLITKSDIGYDLVITTNTHATRLASSLAPDELIGCLCSFLKFRDYSIPVQATIDSLKSTVAKSKMENDNLQDRVELLEEQLQDKPTKGDK